MSEFVGFVTLGFHHIVDVEALDHILFLLALAAIYRFRDWRRVIWVATSFTVGHSITLALAVLRPGLMPTSLIEFLIPVTIVATCVENIVARRHESGAGATYRPVLAGAFGLIHGAGFANYLQSLMLDHVAVPLLGFNVGIELGQLVVLTMIAALLLIVDGALGRVRTGVPLAPFRLRVLSISLVVAAVATRWAIQRAPW